MKDVFGRGSDTVRMCGLARRFTMRQEPPASTLSWIRTAQKRLLDQEGYVRVSSSTNPDDHPAAPGVGGSVYHGKSEAKRLRAAIDAKGTVVQQWRDKEGVDRVTTSVNAEGTIRRNP